MSTNILFIASFSLFFNLYGPWFVKKLVGNVPTIIGHKLPQRMFRGDGYIEQMIDVTADKIISNVMWMSEW